MVRIIRRTCLGVTAFAVFLLSFSPVVFASDVGIEPAYPVEGNVRSESIFIMSIEPEETGKNGIRLINSDKVAHTVEIYPTDGSSSVDGAFSCRQKSEALKEVGSWVALSKQNVTLEPSQKTVVDFTVTVPKGTGPGEHNGCIAVQDLSSVPAKSGSGVLLGFRSAIRLAVTVPGDIVKQLSFMAVKVESGEGGAIMVKPVAKNTGNVSLDVKSYSQIESIFGQKSEVKTNTNCPVVPGATLASCYSTFERPYWGGIYKAQTSLSYNADPNDGIGEKVQKQKRVSKESSYFIAWPDPVAALAEVVALLALIWLLVTPLRRKLRRRRIIQNWEKYVVQNGDTIMSIAAARNAKWKRIAKLNHLKAPYALEPGRVLVVPKPQTGKPERLKKKRQNELDWILGGDQPTPPARPHSIDDQTQVAPGQPAHVPAPQAPTPSSNQSSAQPATNQPAPLSWTSPRESSYAPQQASPEQPVGPQYVPTQFPEYYQSHQPGQYEVPQQNGWSSPLNDSKGYIDDATLVPELRSLWDQDEPQAETSAKPKTKKKPKTRAKRPKKEK
jgi:LysM repeat protein